jgi:nucleoside-diphosphate-sugar epimerase
MVASTTAPSIDRLVMNIGSGTKTSIRTLAQYAIEAVGVGAEWLYLDEQDPGPSQMRADISLARKKLGYNPRVSLQEGLGLMVTQDPRFQPLPRE